MQSREELLAELVNLSPAEIHEMGRNGKLEAILRLIAPDDDVPSKEPVTLARFDELKPAKP